jgi:hypothetical protein
MRIHGGANHDAHHFESAGAAFGTIESFIFVRGRRQTHRNGCAQIAGLWRLRLCAALSINIQLVRDARLNTLNHGLDF